MNAKKCCQIGGCIALLCCLGFLGTLLGLFGAARAIAYINQYGDYVFFPAYSFFATLFIYGLINWKKHWASYLLSLITVIIGVWFASFGLIYTGLITGEVIISLLLTFLLNAKNGR